MFECVINISEGRDATRLAAFELSSGVSLRDRHSDRDHHRSVFTLINEETPLRRDVRSLIETAVGILDLRDHVGVHPRLGVVDVVPFVALHDAQGQVAVNLRDETAEWMGSQLGVPCFLYGPLSGGRTRSLPEVRRDAFGQLVPDFGPSEAHPSAGASAVGARDVLVAWNLWIDGIEIDAARAIARSLRSASVRSLGLPVGGACQVSCNLIDVHASRPSEIYDRVLELLPRQGRIRRAELVGLAPRSMLEREDPARWRQLDLSPERTIEARLGA